MDPIIIAVDGFSSCGKSTLAKALAKRLNYAYMDTGAMYRALTLYFLRNNINLKSCSEAEINTLIDQVDIQFKKDTNSNGTITMLNGEAVEDEIRGKKVSAEVSTVAQNKVVRKRMIDLQRKAGEAKGIVMDGRDIGTKVFPDAALKIFMTADKNIRAARRFSELQTKGVEITFDEVYENLNFRDKNDTEREENPLRKAEDAVLLDNSNLTPSEQLNFVLDLIQEKFST